MATNKFKNHFIISQNMDFISTFYFLENDSKFFKSNRHILLLSDFKEISLELVYVSMSFNPTFQQVSTSPSKIKTNNYLMNADYNIDMIGLNVAEYVRGGVNNNEGATQKEIVNTVKEI